MGDSRDNSASVRAARGLPFIAGIVEAAGRKVTSSVWEGEAGSAVTTGVWIRLPGRSRDADWPPGMSRRRRSAAFEGRSLGKQGLSVPAGTTRRAGSRLSNRKELL
jgi:hypothetical protein